MRLVLFPVLIAANSAMNYKIAVALLIWALYHFSSSLSVVYADIALYYRNTAMWMQACDSKGIWPDYCDKTLKSAFGMAFTRRF